MKVAFIFTSSRDGIIERVRENKDADTALRGMNHILNADYFTIPSKSIRSFLFIPRLLRYDFVIAQDNLFLGYIVSICAKIFRTKTKWIYMAINSSTLIRRNTSRHLRMAILKIFWKEYAHIACLSLEQLEDFARLGILRSNLTFIPFGVDAHFFKPNEVSREGDIIVSVGRDAGRDYSTLLKAAGKLPFPFVIVASPKNIQSGEIIPSNVSVLYDKSLAEIRDLYSKARLVVIPSKDTDIPEGSDCSGQTVILDAMAAGRAVVATHRSWIDDYFVAGKDIVVIEPSDPETLACAISELWSDAPLRQNIALSGHHKVSELYTTNTLAKSLTELMNSIYERK